jgi:hypothetical protein
MMNHESIVSTSTRETLQNQNTPFNPYYLILSVWILQLHGELILG